MRIIRFQYRSKDELAYGIAKGEQVFPVEGSVFVDKIKFRDEPVDKKEIKPLTPVSPSKIVCVGLNYRDHAKELGMPLPEEPILFLKPPTSVIGPGDKIVYPPGVERLDYEAELAVVIKRIAKAVSQKEAFGYILGYTCLNDVTARDLQKKDVQWTRAKSFDTFCPMGPCIETDIDPDDLKIELAVNNQTRQSSHTGNLIFGVEFLVSFISHIMTLSPGDVIATGTPRGVGPLSLGDFVEIRIGDMPPLKNRVAAVNSR